MQLPFSYLHFLLRNKESRLLNFSSEAFRDSLSNSTNEEEEKNSNNLQEITDRFVKAIQDLHPETVKRIVTLVDRLVDAQNKQIDVDKVITVFEQILGPDASTANQIDKEITGGDAIRSDDNEQNKENLSFEERRNTVIRQNRHRADIEQVGRETEIKKTNDRLSQYSENIEDTVEVERQRIFREGKGKLDQICGPSVGGIWEIQIPWSMGRHVQFSFKRGVWKVRRIGIVRIGRWADPSKYTPPSGRKAREVRGIFDLLTGLNDQIDGKQYSTAFVGETGNEVPQVSHLTNDRSPIALNTTRGSLTVVKGSKVDLWFPGSSCFCAEINPANWKQEYWGEDSHATGGGSIGLNTLGSLHLKPNQNEATFAVWLSDGHGLWTKRARKEYGPLCFVKLIRSKSS